jgi:membrane-associated phospholipid phosphatase
MVAEQLVEWSDSKGVTAPSIEDITKPWEATKRKSKHEKRTFTLLQTERWSLVRTRCRSWLLRKVKEEERWIESIQKSCKSSYLMSYFTACGILGTHHFFTVIIPLCHWLGLSRMSRLLALLCALGLYVSNFFKDLFALPRPGRYDGVIDDHTGTGHRVYQISIDVAHMKEYGFPSAHSAMALSMSFFVFVSLLTHGILMDSFITRFTGYTIAFIYSLNVSFSRIYTGMHSITDVMGGLFIGSFTLLLVMMIGDHYDDWTANSGSATIIVCLTCIGLLYLHPSPISACPCFYDSVCFLAVVNGISLANYQYTHSSFTSSVSFLRMTPHQLTFHTWWYVYVMARCVVGFVMIFSWILAMDVILKVGLTWIYYKWNVSKEDESYKATNSATTRITTTEQPYEFNRFDVRSVRKYIIYFGVGWLAIYGCPMVFALMEI